jgi:lipopolysaccharide export LptBFGC system permease protein LptF
VGILGIVIGAKLHNNDLLKVINADWKALWSGIGLAILMAFILALSVCVIIWNNKCVSLIYGIAIFIAFVVFIGLGAGLLYSKRKNLIY